MFIAHRLRLGYGSELCQKDPKPGFASPYDDQIPWAAPKTMVLRRLPLKAGWWIVGLSRRSYNRSTWSCRYYLSSLQRSSQYSSWWESTVDNRTPPPLAASSESRAANFVEGNDVAWCTVDINIPWLDQASISKTWKKEKHNWNTEDMMKSPARYFSKTKGGLQSSRQQSKKRIIRA